MSPSDPRLADLLEKAGTGARCQSRTVRAPGSGRMKKRRHAVQRCERGRGEAGQRERVVGEEPPMAGPRMNPRPKAAPMRPIPLARPSGGVTSAM